MAEAMLPIMAVTQLAGTGLSIKGQLDQADTYSRLADIDTQSVLEQGRLAQQEGFEQGKAIRTQGDQLLSEQVAAAGASGVRADTGSPLLVAAQTARNVELDALTSEYEGQKQNVLAQRQGALIQYDKRLTKRNATMGAVGTLLGGAMNAAMPFAFNSAPRFTGKG